MLTVFRESIIEKIQFADFVSIQDDETIDVSTQCQLALRVWYIDKVDDVQERFFEFVSPVFLPLISSPQHFWIG